MKQSQLLMYLGVSVIILVAALFWFGPSGTGEYADSPDGKYRASVFRLRRGTIFHGRIEYIHIEITESSTGQAIWTANRYVLPGEAAPDYGERGRKFLVWAANSRSLTVPVVDANNAVFIVP
jgi:hypothetical protein